MLGWTFGMDERSVARILRAFPGKRALVLGDVILDRYWRGEASRLSPEAPVPVIRKRNVKSCPGGAANTAANLAAMGAQVDLIGMVGADPEAAELAQSLSACGVRADHLIACADRPTTTKTRIIALSQHIARVDHEESAPVDGPIARRVAGRALELMPGADMVVISDYAKGLLTPGLLGEVLSAAAASGKLSLVDPKGVDFRQYRGASYLKPNRAELGVLTARPVRDHRETMEAGRELAARLGGTQLLVTEGADGMTLFTESGEEHMPNLVREVYDVTGAGDTVLATFAMALAAGAQPVEGMWLAARAAGIAIGVMGAAIVSRTMLEEAALGRAAMAAEPAS
jgi:D-beta-D-heptose 7-phosphate kinase/D-beta-D-heptose 1-phosphate adenosyltransferase